MQRIISSIFFIFIATNAFSIHLGLGYASMTEGRPMPGLNAGIDLNKQWMISGSATGVATKAYYSNAYTLNALYMSNFGKTWMGDLRAGIGLGGMYAKKAILVETEELNGADKEQIDQDTMIGPSFRVGTNPTKYFYVAIEYMMGLGTGSIGNGWGDTGIFALGFQL